MGWASEASALAFEALELLSAAPASAGAWVWVFASVCVGVGLNRRAYGYRNDRSFLLRILNLINTD